MACLSPFSIWAQATITIMVIAGGPGRAIADHGAPSPRRHPRSVTGITATGKTSSAMPVAIIATRSGAISVRRNVRNHSIVGRSSGHPAPFGGRKATDLRSDRRIVVDLVGGITVMTKATVLTDKDRGKVETSRVCL